MFKVLKRWCWVNFMPPDWYMVGCSDNFIRPLMWNGFVWEDRKKTYADDEIRWVGPRVPNQPRPLWTFERDGEIDDGEYETHTKALAVAQSQFEDECIDNGIKGFAEEDVVLIEFTWDRTHEYRIERSRIEAIVEYETGPSDYDQHNVWHKGAGGVL